eukprot:CAMPEP_0115601156 /NCGR_PEP_ID=MMETSP0272-20121206/15256_1 /TAXON_ID=71861 /ORGANISM="Scrippsiella trochoidea, Strain CCMP3099" /LENGTH=34 /DNA_ID= /DNA_START= /DNA_END= /DNA_ORIENTATION=
MHTAAAAAAAPAPLHDVSRFGPCAPADGGDRCLK